MASKKYEMPQTTVSLPQADGRVEITVHENEIWVSDYEGDGTSRFTFVIQRGPLQGSDDARTAVADSCQRDKGGRHGLRVTAARASMAAASKQVSSAGAAPAQPRRAGFWYEDPNWTGHGGPVVVVEQ